MRLILLSLFTIFMQFLSNAQFETTPEMILEMRRDFSYTLFADIDQDGDDDILAAAANTVYMLENDGTGSFSPAYVLLEVDNYAVYIAVEDINSDGLLDIVTLHSDGASYYKLQIWGKTGGLNFNLENSFVATSGSRDKDNMFAYEDLNNDGLKDIITVGENAANYFPHTSGFNFGSGTLIGVHDGVEIADVNNDGWMDIIGGTWEYFRVALNDGAGNFPTLSSPYGPGSVVYTNHSEIEVLDVDGDSDLDVVQLIDGDEDIFLHLNDGTGVYTLSQTLQNFSYTNNIWGLRKHDYNNDGILDVVFKYTSSSMYMEGDIRGLPGDGTSFGSVETLNSSYTGVPPMDFSNNTGNGSDNMLLYGGLDESFKRFTVATPTTPGVYASEVYYKEEYYYNYTNMHSADFNNDGFVDFMKPPLFFINQGNGLFNQSFDSTLVYVPAGLGYEYNVLNHGDLDNDGIEDLIGLYTTPNATNLVYWLGLPGGGFGPYHWIANEFIQEVYVHDINNDGLLDIYFTSHASGTHPHIHYAINQGGNSFNEYEWLSNWNYNNLGVYDPFVDYKFAENDTVSDNLDYAYVLNNIISVTTNDLITPTATGIGADHIDLKDVDGDGLCDIFYTRYTDGIGWIKNEGNHVFTDMGLIFPISGWQPLSRFVDIDNDSDIDILALRDTNIYFIESIGYGNFAPPVLLTSDSKSNVSYSLLYYHYAEDLENDGDLDLVFMIDSPMSNSQAHGDVAKLNSLLSGSSEVSGFVFNDANNSTTWDATEAALPNIPIYLNGNAADYTNQNGAFYFSPYNGVYQVDISIPTYWSLSTDSVNYTVNVTQQNPITDSLYFGLKSDTLIYDVASELVAGFPRCNNEINVWLGIHNTGTLTSSGILELVLDDSLTFVNAPIAADSIVGNHYYWHYDSLSPFDYDNVNLSVLMPDFQSAGDTVTYQLYNHVTDSLGTIVQVTGDTLHQIVVCGYDPNDKTVEPAGLTELGYIPISESSLEYLVRFQNTGTDTVFNVKIIDQIHANLDLSTVEILAYSHPMTTQIQATDKLVFEFDNILLPDSSVNFLESQGFVKFRIHLDSGLVPGDQIFNNAGIYFDSNPPVLTNMTTNTIFSCDSLVNISGLTGPFCTGDSVEFVSNSVWNEQQEWFVNGTSSTNDPVLSYVGAYPNDTITFTSNNAYCSRDTSWVITIQETVSPDLMLPDTVTACVGDTIALLSSYASGNSWYLNGGLINTGTSYNATQSGEYILHVEEMACWGDDSAHIYFYPAPAPVLYNNQDTIYLCDGESVELYSGYGDNNTWYLNGNQISSDSSIVVTQSGLYAIETTNMYCPDAGTDELQVIVPAAPVADVNVINDETLVAAGGYAQYMWLDCNNSMQAVPGETDTSFTPQSAGTYALFVTDDYGCTDSSACIDVGYSGISELEATIRIHPNPASSIIYIDGLQNEIVVNVKDAAGKEILEATTTYELDLSKLSDGTYYLHFYVEDQHLVKRIVLIGD